MLAGVFLCARAGWLVVEAFPVDAVGLETVHDLAEGRIAALETLRFALSLAEIVNRFLAVGGQ